MIHPETRYKREAPLFCVVKFKVDANDVLSIQLR